MLYFQDIRNLYLIIIDCKYDDVKKLKKHKYIIPNNLTFGHFFEIIRKKLDINKEQALFFFTEDNMVLSPGEQILNIYNKKKSSDNFLYVILFIRKCIRKLNKLNK